MKQLPITTAEIHVIPVPADWHTFSKGSGNIMWAHDAKNNVFNTSISLLGFELLGTFTKDDIDFDAAPLFENAGGMLNNKYALRSAIEAAGYYFVNPYGDKPHKVTVFENVHFDMSSEYENAKWQAAQQSVVEKLVIIKKVTPCKKLEILIPCSAFVLHAFEHLTLSEQIVFNYAKFLQRALELWMFVPCGEDNKPLSDPKPENYFPTDKAGDDFTEEDLAGLSEYSNALNNWEAAKERCLFEGFELIDNQLIFEGDTFWSTLEGHGVSGSIEDISHIQIPLTPTALKEIYGS